MKSMISVLAVAVLLIAAPVRAQVPQLQQGVQYKVAFAPSTTTPPAGVVYDHRVYFDGAMQTVPTTALVNGEYQVNLPMWAAGMHNIRISAIPRFTNGTPLNGCVTSTGATTPCEVFATPDPFQVNVVTPTPPVVVPLPPGPIRIIIPATIGQGNTVTIGSPITVEQVSQPVSKKPVTKTPAKKKKAEKED